MTIRRALLISLTAVIAISSVLVTAISIWSLRRDVLREAQDRSNSSLRIMQALYDDRLETLARNIRIETLSLKAESCCSDSIIDSLKRRHNLDILNFSDLDGVPLYGDYPDLERLSPLASDQLWIQARSGETSWGTVQLDSDRLAFEGGDELAESVMIRRAGENGVLQRALFMWFTMPVFDSAGNISLVMYGGRTLNHNNELVDDLRELLFGSEQFNGKPLGAITVFLDSIRVATNVLGPDSRRAIGTVVSPEVQRRVLEEGMTWHDRAYVVDEWYISGYQPLLNPSGDTIGMLYVGLLEGYYDSLQTRMALTVVGPVLAVLLIASLLAIVIVRRITKPVFALSAAAARLREGEWHDDIEVVSGFRELDNLSRTFNEMQTALAARDRHLTDQNTTLEETNRKLAETNSNYMKMLGFITHELKSPLAAMQTMTAVALDGLAGDVPDDTREFLKRIGRSAEELQDMVKNYLDLSRVEQGELEARITDVEFRSEVAEPSVTMTASLFSSRAITLDVACPSGLHVNADPELLRIALSNLLTNAAKYGRTGGKARLTAERTDSELRVTVWNEGEGFQPAEREQLFRKFSRLRNAATRDKRGSGLGLFLCREIIDLHNGALEAESEPGQWALFGFRVPV